MSATNGDGAVPPGRAEQRGWSMSAPDLMTRINLAIDAAQEAANAASRARGAAADLRSDLYRVLARIDRGEFAEAREELTEAIARLDRPSETNRGNADGDSSG